jgi:hypothetical protein
MYDHQTESLWLQVRRQAVTGPMTGAKLKRLPATITSWEKWVRRYPETKVLSYETGHMRDYSNDPYEDYYQSRKGLFSFLKPGPGAEEKELVIGVEIDGQFKAYRLASLRNMEEITDSIMQRNIKIQFNRETDTVTVQDEDGSDLEFISTYWMVWKSIYPETKIYELISN